MDSARAGAKHLVHNTFSNFKAIYLFSANQLQTDQSNVQKEWLVLTVMLLTIVVYIYTVIAFNFFRKFYVSGEEDEVDQKCHDMFTVSYFGID